MRFFAIVCALVSGITLTTDAETIRQTVVIEGVVKTVMRDNLSIDWYRAELETPSNTVAVAVPANSITYSDLRRMIDAEVRVDGVSTHDPTSMLPYGHSQIVQSPLVVLRPPPADPFAAPYFGKGIATKHRQRIGGTVLAVRKGKIFLRSRRHRSIEVLLAEEEKLPEIGSEVTVVGFAKGSYLRRIFSESLLRVDAPANPQKSKPPLDINDNLLFPNHQKANRELNGRIVRIRGTAINGYSDGADAILLKNGTCMVHVDMDFPESGFSGTIPVGSSIEVTGLCRMEFEDYPVETLIPRFRGFAIYPRTAADVKVLSRPPWWTPARLLMVIIILAGCIIAILIWNRTLKTLSERRGKELYLEQIDHAQAELKVEERTRLAVEIHDTLSQILTGVSLQIDAAMRVGKDGFAAAEEYLDTARRMLASCRHELRCCIWDLRSRTFEEKDMTEAVERTIAPQAGTASVSVRFNVPRSAFSDSTAHVALRIIRELVVNAIRHGHAQHIRIAGEFRDGMIRFSVRDDGVGFNLESVQGPAQGHFGLQGIHERLASLGGSMEIESGAGAGAKVTVSFPAEKEEP